MSDFILSQIRTWVPALVGAFLSWVAMKLEIVVSEDTATNIIALFTAAVIGLYYLAVSILAKKWPQIGWMLGSPRKPSYSG